MIRLTSTVNKCETEMVVKKRSWKIINYNRESSGFFILQHNKIWTVLSMLPKREGYLESQVYAANINCYKSLKPNYNLRRGLSNLYIPKYQYYLPKMGSCNHYPASNADLCKKSQWYFISFSPGSAYLFYLLPGVSFHQNIYKEKWNMYTMLFDR